MNLHRFQRLLMPAIGLVLMSQPTVGAPPGLSLSGLPAICDSGTAGPRDWDKIANPALRAIASSVRDREASQNLQITLACGMLSLHRREVHNATVLLRSRDPATKARALSFIKRRDREIAQYEAWLDELSLPRSGL